MDTPDWPTIGASIGAALTTIAAKMGVDKLRGGDNSALKATVEANKATMDTHIKGTEGRFDAMTAALDKVVETATETKLETLRAMNDIKVETLRELSKIAVDVARLSGRER
jgi:uncharacterized protein (UPF0264 family)